MDQEEIEDLSPEEIGKKKRKKGCLIVLIAATA